MVIASEKSDWVNHDVVAIWIFWRNYCSQKIFILWGLLSEGFYSESLELGGNVQKPLSNTKCYVAHQGSY